MISRIIDFSVKYRLAIIAVAALGCIAGWRAMVTMPLDAIPDVSDTQVMIYSHWDRSPDIVEDQVTYPIVTALLGAPKVKTVRGFSDFGYSWVYVIFEDGTDPYWARSRATEYLSSALSRLPEGVKTELGPDATALGWAFQYALVDTSGKHSLADLHGYQDWYLRYYLRSVPGVAEVASVGGYSRQYQVNLDPNRLRAYGIPVSRVVNAVRSGNSESSGRVLEFGGSEYMVRGRGYARTISDFENIALSVSETGSQIRVKDVGKVVVGPDMRRGMADLDGAGEVVSGIVVVRNGENTLDVIDRVKARIKEIEPGFPPGVKLVPIYDRSRLILNTIGTVKETILEVLGTVVLIILIFLWHFPSAAIPIATMPIAVLLSFIPFHMLGISANIMSLGGVAIAFSELVDASIVIAEQTHKKLEIWQRTDRIRERREVVLSAIKEVAGPTFFSLLVIAISFLPVLTLTSQEGRMFGPLAYTKTLTMLVAALLAITVDPALRMLLTRTELFSFRPYWLCRVVNAILVGDVRAEDRHALSRTLTRLYEPLVRWTLRRRWLVLAAAFGLVLVTIPVFLRLGSEAMPPLDEGSLLYMPATLPGISVSQASQLLQVSDRIIHQFPEVDRVLGKAGRANTATDPAPFSMLETLVTLKPRTSWRHVDTWYSGWAPEWMKGAFRHLTPETISTTELVDQMNAALKIPGVNNTWTMPVRGRIDMLTTGIRTAVGIKIAGADSKRIEELGVQIESLLKPIPGARSVVAERSAEGRFLDFQWDREQLARYGVSLEDAQMVVENAIGGDNVSTVVLGRERYPVNVRYMRDFRGDLGAIGLLPVSAGDQGQVPLNHLAKISVADGPAMIRTENGLLSSYVYVDLADRDPESYIGEARRVLSERVKLPAGYSISWSGQYEAMQQTRKRLQFILPVTFFLICLLLYINTGSFSRAVIVLLAVPFSAIGAVWFLYLAGYHLSVAVWVGLIALLGIDAETGVFMLLYLDMSYAEAQRAGRLRTLADLHNAIVEGAAQRLRPKFMTFATTCVGLFPIMWAVGAGSDVMKRIAAPMIGGIFTSFVLELLVYPAIYEVWRRGTQARIGKRIVSTVSYAVLPLLLISGCLASPQAGIEASAVHSSPAKAKAPVTASYLNGELRIVASDSTMANVLGSVAELTGVKIDIPPSAVDDRLMIVDLGPGPARQVLAQLLDDSDYDYLIQASDKDPNRLQAVLLMRREKKVAPGGLNDGSHPLRNPYSRFTAQTETSQQAPVQEAATASAVDPQVPPAETDSSPAPAIAPPDAPASPRSQTNALDTPKPPPLAPPASLTQQGIGEQLRQMYQQRMQLNQQSQNVSQAPLH